MQSKLFSSLNITHGFTNRHDAQPASCVYLKQIHSATVLDSGVVQSGVTEGDGVFSSSNSKIAVKTADCAPVLISSLDRKFSAALHAGWRGFTKGIVAEAIQNFSKHGVAIQSLVATIGPCLCAKHFEVGPEVVEAFRQLKFAEFTFLSKGREDRSHIDLTLAMKIHLESFGLKPENIDPLFICTYCDEGFFSYRREGKLSGSNWSWIA